MLGHLKKKPIDLWSFKFTSLFAIVSKYILQTYLRTALLKDIYIIL